LYLGDSKSALGDGNGTVTLLSTSTAFSPVNHDTDKSDSGASSSAVSKRRLQGQVATKSAVIALSFGIALTAILVIFAVCRFCRSRSGSWKGQRLNVDGEADYLVDGMYL